MADVSYDISSDSSNSVDILGLNDIKADLKLELPQPFKTEGANSLDIKPLKADLGTNTHLAIDPLKLELQADPIKTDSSMAIDLKPAVIDLCLTTNIGKVPSVCIRQPYQHHIGFTLFGTEVWGFTFSGQQETIVEELNHQPKVVWGETEHHYPAPRPAEPPSRNAGGLRVRIGR